MSQPRVALKRGDTRTAIRATLLEPSGSPANLTGASVRFLMADLRGQVRIDRAAEVLDATGGVVRFVPEPGDTDVAGTYRAEFEVTFSDGRKESYPNTGYITVEIIPDLG